VSESFTDDLDRHAGLEEQGGVGVSQVVEPNPGYGWVGDDPAAAHGVIELARFRNWCIDRAVA
jgi:hypothetical protein